MQCDNCKHQHVDYRGTMVCSQKLCFCSTFIPRKPTIADYQAVLANFDTVEEKLEYMYNDIPEFKNLSNQEIVFTYWHYVHGYVVPPELRNKLTDVETITRCRRKLIEKDKVPTRDANYRAHKDTKQVAIQEWVTTN